MRDIKTKPKMAKPKTLDKMSVLPKSKKDFVMEKLLKQRIPEVDNIRENPQKSDNATNYAIDKVESGTRQTADFSRYRAENFVRNRFRRKKSVETIESPPNCENAYNSDVGRDYELTTAEPTTSEQPHTNIKKSEHSTSDHNTPKQANVQERMKQQATASQREAAKTAAENKIKKKEQSSVFTNTEQPQLDGRLKTREYIEQQKSVHTDNTTPRRAIKKSVDGKTYSGQPQTVRKNIVRKEVTTVKKKQAIDKAMKIKTRANSLTAKPVNATKTAKIIKKNNPTRIATKKAAQQARRKAQKKAVQEAAKRTAQAAKATVKATAKLTVKVAQMVVAATKALVSALVAMGGPAVLIIVLIVIIIIAAIAASPFGIFISDEAHDVGSIPLSAIVAECNVEFTQKLDNIENSITHDRTELEGEQANWNEILAVFAVKTAGTDDNTAQDVVVIDETKKGLLKAVFWDMNAISHRTETVSTGEDTSETILYITITGKTSNDMISDYNFNAKQQEALATLLENSDILISATQSLAISDLAAADIVRTLPPSLSTERKNIIKAACSLVGKVNYFWGGKSAAIGWDSNWGKMMKVTSAGSSSTGTIRPFGLDCSGFVTWAFINAGFETNAIGHGVSNQSGNSTRIDWSNAQPGDLAVYSDLSHVGFIAGRDENGNIIVIHCASGYNNVVITGTSGFGFAARPNLLQCQM